MVGRKGFSTEFLPKISAEIRQKAFLSFLALSVLLQKGCLSAEMSSFGGNVFIFRISLPKWLSSIMEDTVQETNRITFTSMSKYLSMQR